LVEIIIPIYKKTPDADDLISINQAFHVLKNHKITFIHPKSLDVSNYEKFTSRFLAFDDVYFKNIHGYNCLMLSVDFYNSFSEKYLLIYQTDCFVFKDELLDWCNKDFDYIGAPWIRSSEKIPIVKLVVERILVKTKSVINYKKKGKFQKDKSLLYNEVGNGGLSLRKRAKFLEVLEKIPNVVKIYLDPKHSGKFYAEDVFFSIEPQRNGINFLKPHYKQACRFSIENKQEKALKINHGKLPFGCHRWTKEKNFWREIFKEFNVEI
jgi:hypothetical protein